MENLNVWLIQNDITKFKNSVSNVKKNNRDTFLYTNCISSFKIDKIPINFINFNTMLYFENTNTVLIFQENGLLNENDIKDYLNFNNIYYNEINLKDDNKHISNFPPFSFINKKNNLKEFWIVNNIQNLTLYLYDTVLNTGNFQVNLYPITESELSLKYSTKKEGKIPIILNEFNGIITTNDKILLLTKEFSNNYTIKQIQEILKELKFKCNVQINKRPKFINQTNKLNKKASSKIKSLINIEKTL